jgi:hypothetical protein
MAKGLANLKEFNTLRLANVKETERGKITSSATKSPNFLSTNRVGSSYWHPYMGIKTKKRAINQHMGYQP